MYDRPTASELIEAAREHVESHLIPLVRDTNPKLYFQTLVAVNVLRIVERELASRDQHLLAEWERLNDIQGGQPLPSSPTELSEKLSERTGQLCTDIRAGAYDEEKQIFKHLKASAIEQLQVANPRYLAALQHEDAGN